MKRSRKTVKYHGRSGKPLIHLAKTVGKRYIMVRAVGGGVKRLYEGSKYAVDAAGKIKRRLKL